MTVTYVDVWRKGDPKHEADALALWEELDILPTGTDARERVKQLAVLAYDGDRLIALSTLNIQPFDQVRQTLAFFREVVHPDYRLQSVGRNISFETRKVIEAYALAHPEEQIGGMAAVHQAEGTGKRAVGRRTRMVLIGYTANNEQVRIGWFDHFTVPANNPTTG